MPKKFNKSLFAKPKSKRIARITSIKSPRAFSGSISKLNRNGLTVDEKRALSLAKARAVLQLKRKNLSAKERRQFRTIANTKLPPVTRLTARGPRIRGIGN